MLKCHNILMQWSALLIVAILLLAPHNSAAAKINGDVDGNGSVELVDAILSLQIIAGKGVPTDVLTRAKINRHTPMRMREALYALQCLSGLRSCDKKWFKIISTTPANEAIGVSVGIVITASFSKEIDPASVDNTTFILTDASNNPIAGAVSANGRMMKFIPAKKLAVATFKATIKAGVKDLAGETLLDGFSWSFSTASGITSGILATVPDPSDLTLQNGYLFFANSSYAPIAKMSVTGEEITPLTMRTGIPISMAIHGQHIFWVDDSGGNSAPGCSGTAVKTVLKMSLLDGSSTKVLTTGDRCRDGSTDIVVDETDVYWVNSTGSPDTFHILKVPIGGDPPEVLYSTTGEIRSLAGDASNIYWTEQQWGNPQNFNRSVKKMPKSGGETTTLASNLNCFFGGGHDGGLVRYGTDLVFADAGSAAYRIMKVSVSGGPLTVLASVATNDYTIIAKSLTLHGDHLFWFDDDSVKEMPISGGEYRTLIKDLNSPKDMMISGNNIVWTDIACCTARENGSIKMMPLEGGDVTTLVDRLDNPSILATDTANVYWIEGGEFYGKMRGYSRIARMPIEGGEIGALAMAIDAGPFAVDDAYVYVANAETIKRIPINGGIAERIIHSDRGNIVDVAVDGKNIYWMSFDAIVYKASLEEGGSPVLLSKLRPDGLPGPMRLFNGFIYWVPDHFSIKKVSVNGENEITLTGDRETPFISDFVVDGTNVYFSEQDSGDFKKVSINGGPITKIGGGQRLSYNFLALDNQNLYWVDQVHLGKVSLSGGTISYYMIPDGVWTDSDATRVTVDEESIYWTEPQRGMIRKFTPK